VKVSAARVAGSFVLISSQNERLSLTHVAGMVTVWDRVSVCVVP
jgi:hypothetical protein